MNRFFKYILSISLLLLYGTATMAQELRHELSGTVLDISSKPLAGANVQLLTHPDGVLIKIELSDSTGQFLIQNLKPGKYQLAVEHFEHAIYQSEAFELDEDKNLGKINMQERTFNLEEVEIVGKKPFIEQHFGKTVLNIENSIGTAGNNALEVLEKAPGLVIDQNDNINMRGRPGVMVMIDGKPVPMSGAELANMLRSLPANAVEKIDLITNPSAKYDAAGSAGIIDIKMKKDRSLGTNGSYSASFGHGRYPKVTQGLQLNHRNKKLNIFGSYNYMYRKELVDLDIYRQFYEGAVYTGAYDQINRFRYSIENNTARIGADYYVSPQTIIGISTYGIFTEVKRQNSNQSIVLNSQRQQESYFNTIGDTDEEKPSGGVNLNFKHTIDTSGREISSDLDYIVYRTSDIQDYTTQYFGLNNEPIRSPYLLHGDLDGDLTIRSAKVDYSQPLRAIGGSLEAGLKSSLVNADNDLRFYDRSNGGNILDANISNHFIYRENINAAYANANKKWEKLSMQLGLRAENTVAKGTQVTSGQEFDRNYTQLFPSGFVGYTFSDKHDLGLSLSRRIDRPTYNQLNPFKSFLDPSTYQAGNPYLSPQLTYSFELTHTLNQKITTKLSYSHTDDVIIEVLSLDPTQDQVVIQTNMNLARLDYYGMTMTVPTSIDKWFNSMNTATLYYGLYRGNLVNTNLSNGRPTFSLNSNNNFIISKTWSAEVIGVYQSREIYGFMEVQPIWFMSMGVQKQLWNRKGNLKLNISDAFCTMRVRASNELTDYRESFNQIRDSRVVTLSFSYRFGGNQVAPHEGGRVVLRRRSVGRGKCSHINKAINV